MQNTGGDVVSFPTPSTSGSGEPRPDSPGVPFSFFTEEDLRNRPKPTWLLEDVLPRGALAMLFGASSTGKTFLALDLAMTVATGYGFCLDRKAESGRVLYIASEGGNHFDGRIDAWRDARGVDAAAEIEVVLGGLSLLNPAHMAHLVARVQARPLALIVIDTFAQCTVGADENSTKDMILAMSAAKQLQQTGTTVLIIHHAGKDAERGARGSSALKDTVDTLLELRKSGAQVDLTVSKQRDGVDHGAWRLRLTPVGNSAVLELVTGDKSATSIPTNYMHILNALASPELGAAGATKRELSGLTNVDIKTVERAVTRLVSYGFVDAPVGQKRQRAQVYVVTEVGLASLPNHRRLAPEQRTSTVWAA